MKHFKNRYAIVLCCLLLMVTLLAVFRTPAMELDVATQADSQAELLALRLTEEEQILQSRREELAAMLNDYYRGQAGEQETARLIEQVEGIRQRVEDLREELARIPQP